MRRLNQVKSYTVLLLDAQISERRRIALNKDFSIKTGKPTSSWAFGGAHINHTIISPNSTVREDYKLLQYHVFGFIQLSKQISGFNTESGALTREMLMRAYPNFFGLFPLHLSARFFFRFLTYEKSILQLLTIFAWVYLFIWFLPISFSLKGEDSLILPKSCG